MQQYYHQCSSLKHHSFISSQCWWDQSLGWLSGVLGFKVSVPQSRSQQGLQYHQTLDWVEMNFHARSVCWWNSFICCHRPEASSSWLAVGWRLPLVPRSLCSPLSCVLPSSVFCHQASKGGWLRVRWVLDAYVM